MIGGHEPAALESEVRLYSRTFPVVFDRARGAELHSVDGRRHLDFFCGAGALDYGTTIPGSGRG